MLSGAQTSSWIVVIYGLPAIPSVVLAYRYRQPLLLTGNVFAIIFFASLGDQFSFAELSGASLLAGAIVLVAAAFGLTRHLAAWIPAPIVQGLIAGAIMPFVAGIFSALSTTDERGVAVAPRVPAMVGAAFLAYLLSRRFLGARLPPIFPAA
ncbi:MAG TPA: benzoate/H(+) symporter BenE family transporter [Candidatus Eisenbacteria bacterium]|nr:benzoate/H(+) symporter BenE family transporter [Candidatus Eisenbacteria bacterium]